MNDLHEMAAKSREAAWALAASSLKTRNAALLRMAEVLENHQADIFCLLYTSPSPRDRV